MKHEVAGKEAPFQAWGSGGLLKSVESRFVFTAFARENIDIFDAALRVRFRLRAII
jgi:hypothetical protein